MTHKRPIFSSGGNVFRHLICILGLTAMASCGGSADPAPQATVAARESVLTGVNVSAAVQQLTIHPGDANVALDVTAGSAGYAGPIVVTLSGLPSGVSAAPITLMPGETGTLYLNASVAADQEQFRRTVLRRRTPPSLSSRRRGRSRPRRR